MLHHGAVFRSELTRNLQDTIRQDLCLWCSWPGSIHLRSSSYASRRLHNAKDVVSDGTSILTLSDTFRRIFRQAGR